jgi:hypothetical protein
MNNLSMVSAILACAGFLTSTEVLPHADEGGAMTERGCPRLPLFFPQAFGMPPSGPLVVAI